MRYLYPDPIDHWSLAADNIPMMPKEGEPGTSQPILDVAAVQAKAREISQYGEDKLMRYPPPDERPLTVGFTREEGEAVLREFYRRYNAEVCGTCLGTGWKDQRRRSLPPIPCPDCGDMTA